MPLRALSLVLLTLPFLLAAKAEEAGVPDHAEHRHAFVRITDGSIRPGSLRVDSEDALGWLNYSRKIARVSFDKDVAERMFCTAKGGFRIAGDRLVSQPIQAFQFASLCRLEPGEYTYRVELVGGAGSAQNLTPVSSREGKIVVTAAAG